MQLEKKILKKYPKLGSSVDPEKLSLTVRSALLAILPVVIIVANASGIQLGESDITPIIEAIIAIITGVAAVLSAIGVIYGAYRKFTNR